VTSARSEAAAAVRIGAGLALRKRDELLGVLRPCFARTEPWLQAGKYVSALVSELPRVNGWSIARHGRDRTPDRTQRLLNHASWDTFAAMSVVRRFAASGLEAAARRGRRSGMVIGAIDETGQEKAGEATAGVKRQYLGCAGRVANGINTVHLSYVREKAGHALIGARQWIPREHLADPVKSLLMGLPLDLEFRTKASWPSTSARMPPPTASGRTSTAETRYTAAAPSCASISKPATRRTCCGCRRISPSPWPRAPR
jgi:DDE superfamily endonuclease